MRLTAPNIDISGDRIRTQFDDWTFMGWLGGRTMLRGKGAKQAGKTGSKGYIFLKAVLPGNIKNDEFPGNRVGGVPFPPPAPSL